MNVGQREQHFHKTFLRKYKNQGAESAVNYLSDYFRLVYPDKGLAIQENQGYIVLKVKEYGDNTPAFLEDYQKFYPHVFELYSDLFLKREDLDEFEKE
jgi:hypothetical protein